MRYSLLLVLIVLSGCAIAPLVTVAPARARPNHAKDIRFVQVDIDRVPMLKAVEAIRVALVKSYGENAFTYGSTAGGYPAKPEGPVTFHGSNVSLEQLLKEFCHQTSWNYVWVNVGMVEFLSGPVPGYQPEIRRPRPNQALERTADRRYNLLSMTSILKSAAQRALVSGRSASSR
jgi:hypothetical protein